MTFSYKPLSCDDEREKCKRKQVKNFSPEFFCKLMKMFVCVGDRNKMGCYMAQKMTFMEAMKKTTRHLFYCYKMAG